MRNPDRKSKKKKKEEKQRQEKEAKEWEAKEKVEKATAKAHNLKMTIIEKPVYTNQNLEMQTPTKAK